MDAVKTLTKHHLSGAPVVTKEGRVIGFISEPNLMEVLFDQRVRTDAVTKHMSSSVHVLDAPDPLSTAASIFTTFGIRRLPVVANGRFVGVVTRRDLLAYSLHHPELLSDPQRELAPALG